MLETCIICFGFALDIVPVVDAGQKAMTIWNDSERVVVVLLRHHTTINNVFKLENRKRKINSNSKEKHALCHTFDKGYDLKE